jgi:predicted DNA-binding transcriptional regulator AlpA
MKKNVDKEQEYAAAREFYAKASDDDHLDISVVCAVMGGSRPLHQGTIYRAVRAGEFPHPVKLGKKTNRWLKAEVAGVIAKRISERNQVA